MTRLILLRNADYAVGIGGYGSKEQTRTAIAAVRPIVLKPHYLAHRHLADSAVFVAKDEVTVLDIILVDGQRELGGGIVVVLGDLLKLTVGQELKASLVGNVALLIVLEDILPSHTRHNFLLSWGRRLLAAARRCRSGDRWSHRLRCLSHRGDRCRHRFRRRHRVGCRFQGVGLSLPRRLPRQPTLPPRVILIELTLRQMPVSAAVAVQPFAVEVDTLGVWFDVDNENVLAALLAVVPVGTDVRCHIIVPLQCHGIEHIALVLVAVAVELLIAQIIVDTDTGSAVVDT